MKRTGTSSWWFKMAVWDLFILVFFLQCIQAENVTALECYECSSMLDEKCGETFEVEQASRNKYLYPCVGYNTMCRKMTHRDNSVAKLIVTRSCWSTMSETHLPAPTCESFMDIGTVCYCKEDNCNGQGTLRPSFFVLGATVPVLLIVPMLSRIV